MSKLTQFQPYRLVTGSDPDMPITNPLRDSILLETKPFTGVTLRCSYATGGGAIAPGYTLETWVYDRSREKFFQDKSRTLTVSDVGDQEFSLRTDGQTILLRVAALAGNQPTLEIHYACRMDSKVS